MGWGGGGGEGEWGRGGGGGGGGGGGEGGGGRTGGPVSTTDIPLSGARTSETEGNPREVSSCSALSVFGLIDFPYIPPFPLHSHRAFGVPVKQPEKLVLNKQAHQVNQLERALSAVCVTNG